MFISHFFPTIDHYVSIISKCITTRHLNLGMTLHSHLIKTALINDPFIANRLIDMYSKCSSTGSARKAFDDLGLKNQHSWNVILTAHSRVGNFGSALKLFDDMPQRSPVCYNSLISELSRRGFHRKSLSVFVRMQKECNGPYMDEFTFVGIVGTCACLGSLKFLRQVHGVAIAMGLDLNTITCNALIDAYGKCGEADVSHTLLDLMPENERDVVSWTSMVVACVQVNRLDDACDVFNRMPTKNTFSWTALISGFVRYGYGNEALDLFVQMQEEGIRPSAPTFVSVLGACADLALVGKGRQIHCRITRTSSTDELSNVFILNALVDMYCKCGDMRSAEQLFERMLEKDIVSWNSMVTGFAQNGLGHESLVFLRKMIEANVEPDHVTFLGVLSACSHTGLDLEALQIFKVMEKDYGLHPRSEHYASLIDLLGRKNRLKEAMDLIESAPNRSDHVRMWGALLGACKVHGNLDIARRAADALFELEPGNAARYVMLSSVYAATNRWDKAHQVRKQIEDKELVKDLATSWIEVNDALHKFAAKDRFHLHIVDVYDVIGELVNHMKEAST